MKDKPVEEVRARRRKLLAEKYGGSVERMVAAAIEYDRSHPAKVVRARRRRTEAVPV